MVAILPKVRIKSVEDFNRKDEDEWKVTATKWKVTLRYGRKAMTFPFWQGTGFAGKEPEAKTVLENIFADHDMFSDPEDIDEFVENFGCMETFSRVSDAIKAYREWKKLHKRFHNMFTEDEISKLREEVKA